MPDAGSLSGSFLVGPQIFAAQLDITEDLIPYFQHQPDGTYLPCVVSPADLYTAMSA